MRERIKKQISRIEHDCKSIEQVLKQSSSGDPNGTHTQEAKPFFPQPQLNSLKELKVAAILDAFSHVCYAPECRLKELTPEGWKSELEEFKPDLFLIESAWRGVDELWNKKVSLESDELFELISYCKVTGIPIVYWAKEDPRHFAQFLHVAKYADFIFTVDKGSIEDYKELFQHDRVHHLHFAAQPALHNPVEKYERKDKFCFAGTYYRAYPERIKVFEMFCDEFIKGKGLDIYDRNYHNDIASFIFPEKYEPYIIGNLKPEEIDVAYKGYTFGINMNTIKDSDTMFARRVFELMASNTIVVGNYSKGVKNYFGDLTISTDDVSELNDSLEKYTCDTNTLHNYRLQALREVLSNHLYEDRLATIASTVFDVDFSYKLPPVTVLTFVASQEEADATTRNFEKQNYDNKNLILVSDSIDISSVFPLCSMPELVEHHLSNQSKELMVAVFDPGDYYDEHYLLDLVLLTRTGDYSGIGKQAYYRQENGAVRLIDSKEIYRITAELVPSRSIVKASLIDDYLLDQMTQNAPYTFTSQLSADEFNYCASSPSTHFETHDLYLENRGNPEFYTC